MSDENTKRLLLLDDDRLVLVTLGDGLRQAGYQVVTANSVEEAEDVLASEGIDLAILDVRMPGQTGIDLARSMRESGSEVPYIFLTAYSDDELVSQATSLGAMGYVVKPADPDRLVPAIESAIARAADARRLRDTGRQLQTALDADRDVSIAIGIVMERCRLGRQAAFEVLRNQARAERRKLMELSREVVLAVEKLNFPAATAVNVATEVPRTRRHHEGRGRQDDRH